MNQLFLFKKLNMVPCLFSDIKLDFENCNKTCIEYAVENFGKNIVFNFPLDMIKTGRFVRNVYPFSITMGIIDDLEGISEEFIDMLDIYDFIVLYARSLDEVLASRNILRVLVHARSGLKKVIILDIGRSIPFDDVRLFIESARIYRYYPVLLVYEKTDIQYLQGLLGLRDAKYCTTKWFNYNVYIFYEAVRKHGVTLSILARCSEPDTKLIMFRDCLSLLCRSGTSTSIPAVLRRIYLSSKPLLQVGDVVIDEEFLNIADSLEEYGSIRLTSKSLGLSYTRTRRVIKELEKLEKNLGVQLIETRRGGSEHGKTSFTHIGRIVMDNIKELYGELVSSYSEITGKILSDLAAKHDKPICVFPLSI